MRLIAFFLVVLVALPAAAFDWEYLGMDGVNATTITVEPLRNRVFVGTHEGFWYFDQATSLWTERDDEGWIGRGVWAVDFADDQPERVITGRENAWWKGYLEYSDDLGVTNHFIYESTGGRVTDLVHGDSPYHWACTWSDIAPGELLRSADAGASWTALPGHGFHAMTDLDLSMSGELYLGGDAGVKWSWDAGASWESMNGDLPGGYGVYCLSYAYGGGDVIPPTSLFASIDPGLYYSFVPGQWTQVLDAACRRILPLPSLQWLMPDVLAAVTFDGRVMLSRSFGELWLDETGDLPGTPLDAAYSPYDRGLYLITSNRGLWRKTGVVTAIETPAAQALALGAHPNPFNPKTTLRFTLAAAGPVGLRIFDVSGRRVATLIDEMRPAGEQAVLWDATRLPSGIYLARLESAGTSASARLVLLK